MNKILTPRFRRWLYGVCIAAVPLAVYFGWLPAEASPVILPLVLALLNVNDEGEAK